MKRPASTAKILRDLRSNTRMRDIRVNAARSRRLFEILGEELAQMHPRVQLAQVLSQRLPQFSFNRLRTALWRAAKVEIGEGSLVMGDMTLVGLDEIAGLMSIGDHTFITGPLRVDIGAPVRIGNNVNIGHDCLLVTVDHDIGPEKRRAGLGISGPIVIEDGVWIACRVTILPGVTIGRGAVVAAGAVVASDVKPHTMVGGVPAKFLRNLSGT